MYSNTNAMSRNKINMWRWPIALGVTSGVGLVSALIGDGAYDVLSWCLLALPLMAVVRSIRSAQ
jgi:hypothetical protein